MQKVIRITKQQIQAYKTGNLNNLIRDMVGVGISIGQCSSLKISGAYFNEDEDEKIYLLEYTPKNSISENKNEG